VMQRGVPFRPQRAAAISNVAGADDRLPGRRPSANEHPYSDNLYPVGNSGVVSSAVKLDNCRHW
jgi:hypothetical protein